MAIKDTLPPLKPTLLLDFANTKTLDPRVTFTRASTATYYDGKTVAKAEENLLLQSQQFDNPAWLLGGVSVTANAALAPDGTMTADLIIPSTASAPHVIYQTIISPALLAYGVSVYARANGYKYLAFADIHSGSIGRTVFDLEAGTVTQDTNGTATITAVGGGWYRCSVRSTENGQLSFGLVVLDANALGNDTATIPTWSGDGVKGIYLWGAQIEQRSAVTAYTPTTTAPITNYIPALQTAPAGVPRFDHCPISGRSLGLLIEEQRANLLSYSEQIDRWTNASGSVATNVAMAPDGLLSADLVQGVRFVAVNLASGTYTFSCYAKKSDGDSQFALRMDTPSSISAVFDLATGAVVNTAPTLAASIAHVGNGYYRCAITCTGAVANVVLITASAGVKSTFVWGGQLEAGAFATSYIPTAASSVTRAADLASMTGANFSSWFRADEGTLLGKAACPVDSTYADRTICFVNDGSTANGFVLRFANIQKLAQTYGSNGGTANQWVIEGGSCIGAYAKLAVAYKTNDIGFFVDGALAGQDAGASIGGANRLNIGNQIDGVSMLCGCIRYIAYYPKRLTNAQLQSLTA